MGETEPQLDISCQQMKVSSTRTRSDELSVGHIGPMGNHKQPRLLSNYRFLSTNWLQGPIAELIGHEEVQLMPT